MAVQKSKVSRSKRDKRRTHDRLKNNLLSVDQTSGEKHRRHHMTENGYYKGRQVIVVNEVVDEE